MGAVYSIDRFRRTADDMVVQPSVVRMALVSMAVSGRRRRLPVLLGPLERHDQRMKRCADRRASDRQSEPLRRWVIEDRVQIRPFAARYRQAAGRWRSGRACLITVSDATRLAAVGIGVSVEKRMP